MHTFSVKTYQPSDKTTWNQFVSQSNQDTFLFYRDFMDYHSDRFNDFSLLIYKKEKLIALFPANTNDGTIYSHQGLTYGNLIYAKSIKTTDYIYAFGAILEFLHSQNIQNIVIKELPSIYLSNLAHNPFQYIVFKAKAELLITHLHSVIDMSFKAYSNSRREGSKRAKKQGLIVKESESLELFWNTILLPNLKQKHGVQPTHTLEEITLLKSKFNQNIRQFNIFHGHEIVGGTTIFEMKDVVHCQYISGNADKNILGGLDLLHMHLLDTVFKDKRYFSFGISNVNNGQHINEGLQFWKEGFGARSMPQNIYRIATKNYKLLQDVFI